MSRRFGLLLLLLFPAAAVGAPEDDPAYWLVRMSEAVRQTTYSGVIVYNSAERMETLRVLHEYRDGAVRERLTSLTGDQREIFRTNNEVICVLPHQKVITVDQRAHEAASLLPTLRRDNIDTLNERYAFENIGVERVADRQCIGVRVMPRDDMRYGYEYWLDKETYLPLRVVVLAPDGQRLEQLMFTDVSFPAGFEDEQFERSDDTSDYRIIRHAGEAPRVRIPARWTLDENPPGFRKLVHTVRQGADDRVPVEHFLFSDGLATISVYGANAPDDAGGGETAVLEPFESNMGALNMITRIVDGHHVTIVGEVPSKTVQWIADRLKLQSAPVVSPSPEADAPDDAEAPAEAVEESAGD